MAKKKRGNRGSTLNRDNQYITTKAGWQLSEEEYRNFRNLVKKVNRKRDKMIKELDGKPLFRGLRQLDESRAQLRMMGEEDEITIRKRSSSINQFSSRKQFEYAMRSLDKVAQTDYIGYRVKLYKRNYMEALKKNFADHPRLVDGIIMKVRMMKPETFAKFMSEDRLAQIKTVYGADNRVQTLVDLREKLGLSVPDEYQDIADFDINQYY